MSSVITTSVISAPKHVTATLLAFAGSVADSWTRARTAQYLADKYLYLSDDSLMARGMSREAVMERIRRIMTDMN